MNISTPLFIVGCPRSGTKLLRALLNNHPDVSLSGEGHYIPLLIKRVGRDVDLAQAQVQKQVFDAFTETSWYHFRKEHNQVVSQEEFLERLEKITTARSEAPNWSHALEAIVRAYGPRPEARIWGDKSHGYIYNMPLLQELFPNVHFIHIVRDPRDQALSSQRAWGKDPLRSAHKWSEAARRVEHFEVRIKGSVLTVRYEDLTSDPAREMARVCAFLEVPEVIDLTTLQQPSENLGDTRGSTEVVSQRAKYRKAFSPRTIRRISEITLPYLERYRYSAEDATQHRPLGEAQLRLQRYLDGFSSLRFHMQQKGALKGARFYLGRRREITAKPITER